MWKLENPKRKSTPPALYPDPNGRDLNILLIPDFHSPSPSIIHQIMSPPDSKTKVRPQQSCLKCRERKVKVRRFFRICSLSWP